MSRLVPIAVLILGAASTYPAKCPAAVVVTPISFGNEDSHLSGFTVEDFEDSALESEVSITWRGEFRRLSGESPSGSVSVSGTLPNTFDPTNTTTDCAIAGCPFPNNAWDGEFALANGGFSDVPDASEANRFDFRFASVTEFAFSRPMTAVGVGLSNFQSADAPLFPITDHTFFVNGQDMGVVEDLAGWTPGIDVRNAYLLFTATDGDVINSIAFQNDTGADGLVFDKLAYIAIPEPSTMVLVLASSLLVLGRRLSCGS